MTPSQLASFLAVAWPAKIQALITGEPGIGKTDIVSQAAKSLSYDLVKFHPAVSEPVDFKGYPVAKDGVCRFIPDEHLNRLITTDRPTIAFADDLGQSHPSVQAAFMQILHGGQLNNQKISPCVVFCGATNDVSHQAGVQGFIEPLKSRWHSIVKLDVSVEDWVTWAYDTGQPSELIACIKAQDDLLSDFKPSRGLDRSPDPRSWGYVGDLIHLRRKSPKEVNPVFRELVAGAVGKGPAAKFAALLELAEKAPDIDAIIRNPGSAELPQKNQPSVGYMIVTSLVRRATKQNIDNIMTYLHRLDQPLRVLCMDDMHRHKKDVCAGSKSIAQWRIGEGLKIFSCQEEK